MKQQYAVIGLGRFGTSVARHLAALGQEVLAIDANAERVRELDIPGVYAVQGNATKKSALQEAGVQNVQSVVIAIGENIESSILATMICKELGVPKIITKAVNSVHADVLEHIGVSRVVFPEEDMGARLARNMVSGLLIDYIDLGPNISIMEISVPQSFAGKSLAQLQLRRKLSISVLAIKRDEKVIASPHGEDVLHAGDLLVVLGARDAIERLRHR